MKEEQDVETGSEGQLTWLDCVTVPLTICDLETNQKCQNKTEALCCLSLTLPCRSIKAARIKLPHATGHCLPESLAFAPGSELKSSFFFLLDMQCSFMTADILYVDMLLLLLLPLPERKKVPLDRPDSGWLYKKM